MRVRRAVGIDEGDVLVFTVGAQGKVTLERLNSDEELDALSATFGEWGSAEDDEAYRDL
jgi:bifunctional DNA-binding transcriptional regulator/antitoxin component of YhaV-PrlF toxin-antitoxin module